MNIIKIPLKEVEIVITTIVCDLPATTGHMGTLASVYPLRFLGASANVKIWSGIQESTKRKKRSPATSMVFTAAVLPARAGNPPAIPPKRIEKRVLLFSNME